MTTRILQVVSTTAGRYGGRAQRRNFASLTAASTGPFVAVIAFNTSRFPTSASHTTSLEGSKRYNHHQAINGSTSASKPLPSRNEQIQKLKTTKQYDVLIVGGGATGAGAALDAATRGLSTAMIERGDFGNETSSRSTKLIWAGIRYIATGFASLLRWRNISRPMEALKDFYDEYSMVKSAHKERRYATTEKSLHSCFPYFLTLLLFVHAIFARILLENNPHLTYWVPIAIPMNTWLSWPPPFGHPIFASAPITLPGVFKFYDSMSNFSCPPSHIMSIKRANRKFPQLDEGVKYFQIFYEGAHNDARTATYIALTAAEEGATVANYVEMIGLLTDENTGKAIGVKCRDNMTGEVFDTYAKSVVFAGGPFTDQLRKLESPEMKPAVAAAAGTHIVLPGYYCPAGIGMLDINTSDGRFLFFLPWQGHTIVGTTDRKGPVESTPEPPEEEIQWILREVEKYLSSDLRVRRADVLSAWQGFRPLASDPHAPPDAPVSRDHIVSTNPETGVTFITGGKWTTYRHMAEDVIDRILDQTHGLKDKAGPCVTDKLPLRGGVGYTRNVPIQLIQDFGVSESTAQHLASTYGIHAFDVCRLADPTNQVWPRFGSKLLPQFPYLECEIEYACRNEMVCTLKDMLTLRLRIAYLNKDAALSVAPRVADLMANALGWSRSEKKKQLQEAIDHLHSFGGAYPKDDKDVVSTVSDVRDLFRTFDTAGNGYIDLAELQGAAKMLGLPFKDSGAAMKTFEQINKNKDGKITEEEFVAWWDQSNDKFKKNLGEKFLFQRNE